MNRRLGFRRMEAVEHTDAPAGETGRALQGVYRYYELAKRAEWQVRDLPWGEIPPIPEYRARRRSSPGGRTSGAR